MEPAVKRVVDIAGITDAGRVVYASSQRGRNTIVDWTSGRCTSFATRSPVTLSSAANNGAFFVTTPDRWLKQDVNKDRSGPVQGQDGSSLEVGLLPRDRPVRRPDVR